MEHGAVQVRVHNHSSTAGQNRAVLSFQVLASTARPSRSGWLISGVSRAYTAGRSHGSRDQEDHIVECVGIDTASTLFDALRRSHFSRAAPPSRNRS